ncbi:prepilin-type N-terminal cleavage/methylation domain-containing protein [Thermodesulfobacteriota bacterium]
MKYKHGLESGFTLIEVMVASVVLMMGMLFLLNMQMVAAHGNMSGRRVTEASALAKNCIDRLVLLDFDDADLAIGDHVDANNPLGGGDELMVDQIDDDEEGDGYNGYGNGLDQPTKVKEGERGGRIYRRVWSVTGDDNMKTLTTVVRWSDRNDRKVTLNTIITR